MKILLIVLFLFHIINSKIITEPLTQFQFNETIFNCNIKHLGTLKARNTPFIHPVISALGFYECGTQDGYLIVNRMWWGVRRYWFVYYIDHLMKEQKYEYDENKNEYKKTINEITEKFGNIEQLREKIKSKYNIIKHFDYSLKLIIDRSLGIDRGLILNNDDYYEEIKNKNIDPNAKAYFQLVSTSQKLRTNLKKEDLSLVDRCMEKNDNGEQIGKLNYRDEIIFKVDKNKNIQFFYRFNEWKHPKLYQQFKIGEETFEKFYALLLRRYYPTKYY